MKVNLFLYFNYLFVILFLKNWQHNAVETAANLFNGTLVDTENSLKQCDCGNTKTIKTFSNEILC